MSNSRSDMDNFNAALQEVEQKIAAGDLPRAASRLNELGRAAPGHPLVYMLGARLGEAAGNAAAALKSARRAVELAPQWHFPAIELARLLERQSQTDEALRVAQQAIDLAPDDLSVLTSAVDIAHHGSRPDVALPWLTHAAGLDAANPRLRRLMARDLSQLDRNEEADALFDDLLNNDPDDAEALAYRMSAAFATGDLERAAADADRLVALEPENPNYLFWQQRAHGQVPRTQPDKLVAELFDRYAQTFDLHLVRTLKYDTPREVAQWIQNHYPDLKLNVLDLGCGTGLLGLYLGRINGALIGVDLSVKMVEQAARHNVYDRFHTVNLLDALAETPPALYHVITACDVFIYVGELGTAIPNAWRVLRPDGYLIFTCEEAQADGPDLVLLPSNRYAHKLEAVEALCRSAGFDTIDIERIELRKELENVTHGFRVIAHKPA